MAKEPTSWRLRDAVLDIGSHSVIVGILNATPDSFSDGGKYLGINAAIDKGLEMMRQGARVIDIGGESTRPDFTAISEDEESNRVVPVIEGLLAGSRKCILSIDTTKSAVAKRSIDAGAKIVNDVSGFRSDPSMAALCAEHGVGVILMRNGRLDKDSGDILDRVRRYWEDSVQRAKKAGVDEGAIVLDPGVGFGTTRSEDLEILRNLEVLRAFGFPVMLGVSRKRVTAEPLGLSLDQRLTPTLVATVTGVAAGVELFRVHDVLENYRAAVFADLVYKGGDKDG